MKYAWNVLLLTLKRLGHIFQNVILFSNVFCHKYNFDMKLDQYNEYWFDALTPGHQ